MEEQCNMSEVEFYKRQPKDSSDDQKQEVASMDEETLGLDQLSITPIKSSIQDLKAVTGLWYKINVLSYLRLEKYPSKVRVPRTAGNSH
jgi:hypothetical protein